MGEQLVEEGGGGGGASGGGREGREKWRGLVEEGRKKYESVYSYPDPSPLPAHNLCPLLPYSAYISRVFNFANFVNLELFAKLFQPKMYTRLQAMFH